MRISDWSSDVCSSDLSARAPDSLTGGPATAVRALPFSIISGRTAGRSCPTRASRVVPRGVSPPPLGHVHRTLQWLLECATISLHIALTFVVILCVCFLITRASLSCHDQVPSFHLSCFI